MRIQIITNLFYPDELAGAALFTDLALFLKECGHDVRVTCPFSYYPAWRLRPEDEGVRLREDDFEGIPLRRVRMYVPRRPTVKRRMLSDLSLFSSLIRWGRYADWEPAVVLTASPMLSQCLAQRFMYLGKSIPRMIVVQDFVVDAALELGMLQGSWLAKPLQALQRWAFRSAQTLSTISPIMLEKLQEVAGPNRRILYISNWIHGSLKRAVDQSRRAGYHRKVGTLLYAGNIGVKQGLPAFLEQFRNADGTGLGWTLKIHGGGAERDRLAEEVGRMQGMEFGPVLEESAYVAALSTCSACLVTQRPGVGANFLPSKLLPALATGTPVLAVCERSSPLGQEVLSGAFGEVIEPGNSSQLAQTLDRWRRQPQILSCMANKSQQRANAFQRSKILAQYEEELVALTRPNVNRDQTTIVCTKLAERESAK
jgi:colanic acid biosynthesis glycosyl transferase WcaI